MQSIRCYASRETHLFGNDSIHEPRIPAKRASWDPHTRLTSYAVYAGGVSATEPGFLATTMSSISSVTATAASRADSDCQDESTSLTRLLEVSTAILRQAIELVENGLTSDEQLTTRSIYIPGSTIGMLLYH